MMGVEINVMSVSISSFATISIVLMLISFIRNEYKYTKYGLKFWTSPNQILLSLIVFTLAAIFAAHTSINALYAIIISSSNFDPRWCISNWTEMWSFSFGKLFLYSFFILRLHQVFRNSTMAVSVTKLKSIAITVYIPLIIATMYVTKKNKKIAVLCIRFYVALRMNELCFFSEFE